MSAKTTTIVDELMGLVAAVTDASGLDFSAYVAARSKLESRLRELLIGEAVKLPAAIDYGRNATHYQSGEEEGWNACLDELAKLGPLYLAPRPFDAGAISDERIDAALGEWFDSCPIADAIARGVVTDYDIPSLRIDMRRAISAALVQP